MRPLLIGDLVATARVLIGLDETEWPDRAGMLFERAQLADHHRRETGRSHPVWGNGSLMSVAAVSGQLPEPYLSDTRYLRALRCAIDAAISRKDAFPSGPDRLYTCRGSRFGVVSDGRDTSENGVDRSGVAEDLRRSGRGDPV